MQYLYPEVLDFSDMLIRIPSFVESIAITDKTIDCDRLINQQTGGANWKNFDYPEMASLLAYLKLIFDIASDLKSLERKTKVPSSDRVSKLMNYVSTKTGEIYPHWSAMPESYLLILNQKINSAIAEVKAA